MSSRYYLPLRHDVIAKTVYNEILPKENPDKKKLITRLNLLRLLMIKNCGGTYQ